MPEIINVPLSFKQRYASGINSIIISARILATITSAFLSIPTNKLFASTITSLAIGFKFIFSFAEATATSSKS